MKKIKLTKGLHALVDDEDFDSLNKFKWCACYGSYKGSKVYAIRVGPDGKKIRMHREVMGLKNHHKRVVDHIDADTLDNRKCNLQIVTQKQNMARTRKIKRGRSLNVKIQGTVAEILAQHNPYLND